MRTVSIFSGCRTLSTITVLDYNWYVLGSLVTALKICVFFSKDDYYFFHLKIQGISHFLDLKEICEVRSNKNVNEITWNRQLWRCFAHVIKSQRNACCLWCKYCLGPM